MNRSFENADYYDVDEGAESLMHTCWEECIEDHWSDQLPDARVEDIAPLTIYAYHRREISEGGISGWAQRLTEYLGEMYAEDELADPDGNDVLGKDAESIMHKAVSDIMARTTVWACEQTFQRVFSLEEVRAILGEQEGTPSDV